MQLSFRSFSQSIAVSVLAVVSVGCAQLSPQQISFQPTIPTDSLITGEGTTSLEVNDTRSDKVIGVRGGTYEQTSTIVSKEPLDDVIRSLAMQVLEKTGMEISTAFPDMEMAISLDKLSFISEDLKASVKRSTAVAAVSIRVKKGTVVYENGYKTTQYIDTVGYPNEEKNEELLNNVFDAVLERLFSDSALETFINK
jgi:uncharacterized lipoprotein